MGIQDARHPHPTLWGDQQRIKGRESSISRRRSFKASQRDVRWRVSRSWDTLGLGCCLRGNNGCNMLVAVFVGVEMSVIGRLANIMLSVEPISRVHGADAHVGVDERACSQGFKREFHSCLPGLSGFAGAREVTKLTDAESGQLSAGFALQVLCSKFKVMGGCFSLPVSHDVSVPDRCQSCSSRFCQSCLSAALPPHFLSCFHGKSRRLKCQPMY